MLNTLEKPKSIEKKLEHEIRQEIREEWVAELAKPLEKILEQIGSRDFDLIIGDDASGRIPTLIIYKFFKVKAEREGRKLPQVRFFALSTRDFAKKDEKRKDLEELKKERITQSLEKIKNIISSDSIHPHTLIVTDNIETGRSLKPLVEALKELGFNFNIAAIGITRTIDTLKRIEGEFGTKIIHGMHGVPSIWQRYIPSGVIGRKDKPSAIHSQTSKKYYDGNAQKTINLSREDANIIADRLIEKFLKN